MAETASSQPIEAQKPVEATTVAPAVEAAAAAEAPKAPEAQAKPEAPEAAHGLSDQAAAAAKGLVEKATAAVAKVDGATPETPAVTPATPTAPAKPDAKKSEVGAKFEGAQESAAVAKTAIEAIGDAITKLFNNANIDKLISAIKEIFSDTASKLGDKSKALPKPEYAKVSNYAALFSNPSGITRTLTESGALQLALPVGAKLTMPGDGQVESYDEKTKTLIVKLNSGESLTLGGIEKKSVPRGQVKAGTPLLEVTKSQTISLAENINGVTTDASTLISKLPDTIAAPTPPAKKTKSKTK